MQRARETFNRTPRVRWQTQQTAGGRLTRCHLHRMVRHIERLEAKGLLTRKYGHLSDGWREMMRKGFAECFRVLREKGTLIFKWAESDHPVSEVLRLTPEKPLFGHKSGAKAGTHWICFLK